MSLVLKKMSTPKRTIAKKTVTVVKNEAQDFQKRMFGESCKKLIEGFVAGHVRLDNFLAQLGMFAENYCSSVGRGDELEFLDLSPDENEEDFIDVEEEYPATQPYGD